MEILPVTSWEPSKQLFRGNAAEQLLDDLREQIVSGKIARGAKLPTEKELATAYGVSGATVREAIRGLAASRLVEVRHGSGAYVTAQVDELVAVSLCSMIQMERITIAQVLAVYGAINAVTAELAAKNATKADLTAMQEALDDMDRAATLESIADGLTRFLDVLARSSGNPLLAALCRFLAGVQIGLATELSGGSFAIRRKAGMKLAKERQGLVDAIKSRDPEAARVAARLYHERAATVLAALPHAKTIHVANPALSKLLATLLHRQAV
jgi:GntR family transcriptional repressor for pyruvate dehydrogenase complex